MSFSTVDAQSLAKKLHEAKSLQIKQQRQLKDVLLKECSTNSDELQELRVPACDSDLTNLVGILDDDIVEIEKLAKELNCISTIRVAYMESH